MAEQVQRDFSFTVFIELIAREMTGQAFSALFKQLTVYCLKTTKIQ